MILILKFLTTLLKYIELARLNQFYVVNFMKIFSFAKIILKYCQLINTFQFFTNKPLCKSNSTKIDLIQHNSQNLIRKH